MLESVAKSDLRGNQRPGLLHLPDGSDAYVDDALYLLGEWGFGYDDWQNFTMSQALREQPDGRWSAKEFVLEIPRQNGKGELIEGREALGLFYLDERKLIHSAHEFATASEALDRMEARIDQNPALKQRLKKNGIKRSHGEEGVYLKDGRKLLYKTRTKGGGRGFSADLLILDEAMFIAEAFLGALMPVISARPNPQMWLTGSAVDQESMENGVVFARFREAALESRPGRMAYLGWSPAYSDGGVRWEKPADVPTSALSAPEVVAQANPALGIRIELEHVLESELVAMDNRTFCVERLGVGDWPKVNADGAVISAKTWLTMVDRGSKRSGGVWFAFAVALDRSFAAIAAAGRRDDGLFHVEIVEHKRGTDWVVDRLSELRDKHAPEAILYNQRGPAASLEKELENAEIMATPVTSSEDAQAFGVLFDAVDQRTVRHLGTAELVRALKGAQARHVGEAKAWSPKDSTVDICPLTAVTLALWGSVEQVRNHQLIEVFG